MTNSQPTGQAVPKISDLTTLQLRRYLRHIGREDHNQLIFAAEKALFTALDGEEDWDTPMTRLEALETEGRAILRAAVIERRSA